jgi:hypothetical protein
MKPPRRELLRLSQGASRLLPYRNQLRRIRIKEWKASVTPARLSEQRRLEHLEAKVGPEDLLELLRVLRGAPPGQTLQRLHVTWNIIVPFDAIRPDVEVQATLPGAFAGELGAWLRERREGGPPFLAFSLGGFLIDGAAAEGLIGALKACPDLQELEIRLDWVPSYNLGGGVTGEGVSVIAAALSEGWAPQLRSLHLDWTEKDWQQPYEVAEEEEDADDVARALLAHPRPLLRSLKLEAEGGNGALAEALTKGACPGLTSLRCKYFSDAEAEAVLAGACPDLRRLSGRMNYSGVEALTEGILSHRLSRLESLCLNDSDMSPELVVALFGALEAWPLPCPSLRELEMERIDFGSWNGGYTPDGCRAIAQAMRQGALPCLERLRIRDNNIAADSGVALAEGLEAGACPNLTTLDLCRNHIGARGGVALGKALKAGGAPRLTTLNLGHNGIEEEGAAALAEAFRAPGCVQLINEIMDAGACALGASLSGPGGDRLRKLFLRDNEIGDAGCRALARAMGGTSLLCLKELSLVSNHIGSSGAAALAGALEAGGAANLTFVELWRNRWSEPAKARLRAAVPHGTTCHA